MPWRLAILLAVFGLACGAASPASPLEHDAGETPELAPIEVGGQPSDDAIQRRIGAVLSRIEEFSDVRVTVVDGVVTLSGTELRPRLREKLEALVSRFDGVVYVDDRLEEAVAVEKRVTPALSKIQRYAREAIRLSPLLIVAFAVVATAGLFARLLGRWETPWRLLGFAPMARDMAQRLAATVIFLIGLLVALDLLEATALVGAVLGVAGVTGLAIGFAFRDIAENYIAGVLLSVRHRFAIGDHLLIQQHEGKILRLTSRELMLMTLDGDHLSIPNSTVFKSIVCNYTRNPRRRFDFALGIGPSENPVKVRRIGTETLRNLEGVLDEPAPTMRLEELGDWSVQVKFYGWVDQERAEFLKVRSEAIRLVKAALDAKGVVMPEPTWQVHLLRDAREPKKTPLSAADDEVDVTRDTAVDDQIREDLARDGETLLE